MMARSYRFKKYHTRSLLNRFKTTLIIYYNSFDLVKKIFLCFYLL